MAEQYAFGDDMFPSNIDASFVSHQYLVAAQAEHAVNFTKDKAVCRLGVVPHVSTVTDERAIGPSEDACFGYHTIVDELAAHSLPWRYYMAPRAGGFSWWNPFEWIPHDANAPDGQIVAGPSQFIDDIKSRTKPYDAAVTWVTPTAANSDHAGVTKNTGPNWVASVVNAIGTSKYWDSSVIFITWDDWGGWYDHVSPPFKDYDGLGIRVPFHHHLALHQKGPRNAPHVRAGVDPQVHRGPVRPQYAQRGRRACRRPRSRRDVERQSAAAIVRSNSGRTV